MLRSTLLAPLAGMLLSFTAQQASGCYYSALDLENPNDYYYRYCYANCANLEPAQGVFNACCTPLPAGATAPASCATASESYMAAGGKCEKTDVPTTNFPTDYSYTTTSASSTPPPVTTTTTSSGVEAGSTDSPPAPEPSTSTQIGTSAPPPPGPSSSPVPPPPSSSPAPPPGPSPSESDHPPAPGPETKTHDVPPHPTPTPTPTPKPTPPPNDKTGWTKTVPVPKTKSQYKNCWCGKDDDSSTTCEDHQGKQWHKTKGEW